MSWYNYKNEILEIKGLDKRLILSQDRCVSTNAKQFKALLKYQDYINYLESNKGEHFYEIIYDNKNYKTYIYFDIDRSLNLDTDSEIINNYESYNKNLIEILLKKIENFIDEFYKYKINFEIGNTVQVSLTELNKENPKLSIHLKINIIMTNTTEMKEFRDNLANYLLSNIYTNEEDRNLFYFYNKKGIYECILDNSVYSNFRSYRTIYSSKINKKLQLLPFMNSSNYIKDHLVLYNKENNQETININLSNTKITIEGNYKDLDKKTLIKTKFIKSHNEIKIEGKINNINITEIQKLLQTNNLINEIFYKKLNFKDNLYIKENIYRFCIVKSDNHVCPYAKRVHSNNRSYFDYYEDKKTVVYGCFSNNCKDTKELLSFFINNSFDALSKLNDFNSQDTLHCKNNIIEWKENYINYEMKNYPLNELVAIRGNMGIGKTNELINTFIKKNCSNPNTKCLFITYQILLSKKYYEELEEYGFINYLDRKNTTTINDNKVIICLDSIWKINTKNFDYIFIDEAMSVLLHFNSPFIKDINLLSLKFELLLLQAEYVYLLDACVDNSIVYNFTNYLEKRKKVKTYWIKNTYIRNNNRKAKVIINKTVRYKKTLEVNCLNHIVDLLKIIKRLL
jgi:hypothetical protein